MATSKEFREKYNNLKLEKAMIEKEMRMKDDFLSGKEVVRLSDYPGIVKNRDDYPDTAVVHEIEDTITIFDTRMYTKKEVNEAFFTIESMAHQIKYLTRGNLADEKKEELYNYMEQLEAIKIGLGSYYLSMCKALADKGGKNKPKQNNRQVGGIGINSSMFK